MAKIKRSNLNQYRNNEQFQYHTDFKNLVEKFTPEALKVEKLFKETYLPLYQMVDEVLIKIRKSALTEEKLDADRQRDTTFRGMIAVNKACLIHFDKDTCAAGKRLKLLFDTYGNIPKLPLQEETSAIYNLIQEMRGAFAEDVQKTGLFDWVNKLETDNLAFEELVKKGYEETAAKTDLKVKEVRSEVDTAFRSIIDRIEALILIEGEENYMDFVRLLNAQSEKYDNTLAQRKGISVANAEKNKNKEQLQVEDNE